MNVSDWHFKEYDKFMEENMLTHLFKFLLTYAAVKYQKIAIQNIFNTACSFGFERLSIQWKHGLYKFQSITEM